MACFAPAEEPHGVCDVAATLGTAVLAGLWVPCASGVAVAVAQGTTPHTICSPRGKDVSRCCTIPSPSTSPW